MSFRFIATDDEGNGYNIDDSTGDVYDAEGNQIDSNPNLSVLQNGDTVNNTTGVVTDVYGDVVNATTGVAGDMSPASPPASPPSGAASAATGWGDKFQAGADAVKSILDSVSKATGMSTKDLLAAGLGAWAFKDAMDSQKEYAPPKSASALLGELPSNAPPAFSAEQMTAWIKPLKTGTQLERQYAADMPSAMTPGIGMPGAKYAEGGEVLGALGQMFDSSQQQGLVSGQGGGQDDLVEARLSPGEYVFDAESVAMLGDGDNAAGARKLDELRQQLRAHKRSAPDDAIAPPAQGPLSYLGA